jgi:hypothetical protein
MHLGQHETVIHRRAANIRKKAEYAGGMLTLTNRRLVVEAHGANLDPHPVEIPLVNIASVEPFGIFGFVPTGVRIALKDGREERLAIWGRRATINAIRGVTGL